MGDHSRRPDRSRSRSPSRRHADRERDAHRERSHRKDKEHSDNHSHRRGHGEDNGDGGEDQHRRHHHSSRSHGRDETEEERRERKRAKRDRRDEKEQRREERRERRERKDGREDRGVSVVDDDADMWVEKDIDAEDAVATIPTSDSLPLRSHVSGPGAQGQSPPPIAAATEARERDSWMLEPHTHSQATDPRLASGVPHSAGLATSGGFTEGYGDEELSNRTLSGGVDFFSSLGTEHKRKDPNADKPDPSKPPVDRRELNAQLVEGKTLDQYETKEKTKTQPGGPGHQWRMMKLKRLYEQAEEQGRDVEEIALERYGSIAEFDEAREERRVLDEREQRRQSRRGQSGSDGHGGGGYSSAASSGMRTPDASGGRRFMFTSEEGVSSRPASRTGFRRPGEQGDGASTPGGNRVEELRRRESGNRVPAAPKVSTPIPSVFTPQSLTRAGSGYPFDSPSVKPNEISPDTATMSGPPKTTEELNRLQAKVLRAKLMGEPNAEELEAEYERERDLSLAGGVSGGLWAGAAEGVQGQMGRVDEEGNRIEVQMLPTLDGRGQLYDVGTGKEDDVAQRPGNRRKKPEKFETRDRQGNLLRYNADDDEQTLGELVRQERFGAGSADQKNLDAEMATAIAGDARFDNDLDYIDDNAERLARHKMKSDAMKRAFAIKDFARTKRALDTCPFCYQDDRQPLTAIVALGTRTYLCCTLTEELVPGHCLIVPIQHCLSSLEMEDDDWEEVRNFMKCLMRMYAKENKGVLFYETILSFRQQRHTYIEAVPVPAAQFADCPAYFRESILASESEWTQHKKLIDFSARPGGFRRALVPNMPYFMVQWDHKGEKGYGHVIEGVEEAGGAGAGEDEMGMPMDEGDKGGGEFPKYFAAEIIGNILGLEPRKWLRPKKIDFALNKERARTLGTKFQPYNWTVQLEQQ
ncbi:hypothetical protein EHS25_004695 [Saitozyma podzolica]|uniref:Uncharacterized protein n=1 Tax=Saitozyma podzolica TaxID=1890683 RepID=A0A427YV28_9TREE|nr:hypothetical protein EHS25_004695 [Saitozyma podzolica]